MVNHVTSEMPTSGSVPVPDPTELTAKAIRELRAELTNLWDEKFNNITKQVDRFRFEIDTRPAAVIMEIQHLATLTNEKLKGVDQQFAGRDTALAAALLAQKTSVDEQNKSNAASASKSEVGFDKRIEGIAVLIASQTANIDGKVTDLKDRITAIESRGKGFADVYGWMVAFIGMMVGGGGLIAFLVNR